MPQSDRKLALLLALVISAFGGQSWSAEPQIWSDRTDQSSVKSELVEANATAITEPLSRLSDEDRTIADAGASKDGSLVPNNDYFAALNRLSSRGVTAENNAAIPFWQAVGTKFIDRSIRNRYLVELGIRDLQAEHVERFISWPNFALSFLGEKVDTMNSLESQNSVGINAWLTANEKPLEDVALAARRDFFFSPLIPELEDDFLDNAIIDFVILYREVARAFGVRASERAKSGDTQRAVDDLVTCYRLARLLSQSAVPIIYSTAVGIERDANEVAAEVILNRQTGNDARKKLQEGLERLPELQSATDMISQYDRSTTCQWTARISNGGPAALFVMLTYRETGEIVQPPEIALEKWAEGSKQKWQDALAIADKALNDRAVAIREATPSQKIHTSEVQYGKHLHSRILKHLQRRTPETEVIATQGIVPDDCTATDLSSYVLILTMTNLRDLIEAEYGCRLRASASPVLLALAEYRDDHDSFPRSLQGLVPDALTELPLDAVGQPFIYNSDGQGFRLYSLGLDGVDDGGDPVSDAAVIRSTRLVHGVSKE